MTSLSLNYLTFSYTIMQFYVIILFRNNRKSSIILSKNRHLRALGKKPVIIISVENIVYWGNYWAIDTRPSSVAFDQNASHLMLRWEPSMADTIINFIICTPASRVQIFDHLCSKRISLRALYAKSKRNKEHSCSANIICSKLRYMNAGIQSDINAMLISLCNVSAKNFFVCDFMTRDARARAREASRLT